MRSKILLAFSVLVLLSVAGAHAIPSCSCNCTSSCTNSCIGPGGVTNCGTLGTCTTSPGCSGGGGGGCLTAAKVSSLVQEILSQPAVVPVGGQEGRAAARLTWRLTQHVEEGKLGEVYTAGTGFVLSNGHGKMLVPQLAFVSRDRVHGTDTPGAFRHGAPDLVAELLSSSNNAAAARQDAQSWLNAGARAVLVLDADGKTVAVYRGGEAREMAGPGGTLDLSDVVPGWSLRIDDLFE
ncbi:MAG TPA: Uma2 family endonuclease [Thermoanaerobaculia bacterium]